MQEIALGTLLLILGLFGCLGSVVIYFWGEARRRNGKSRYSPSLHRLGIIAVPSLLALFLGTWVTSMGITLERKRATQEFTRTFGMPPPAPLQKQIHLLQPKVDARLAELYGNWTKAKGMSWAKDHAELATFGEALAAARNAGFDTGQWQDRVIFWPPPSNSVAQMLGLQFSRP